MERFTPDVGASVLDPPETPPASSEESSSKPALSKKELKLLLKDGSRPLDPWERYRALNDAMDEAFEITDISNREARFALLVMGILNAFVVIAASRSEVVEAFDGAQFTGAALMLGIYAVTAVYFLFQAIEALRPGRFRPHLEGWRRDADDFPRGVRYYEDVITRDVVGHWRAWQDVQMNQLNAELAVQFHSLCYRSNVKRVALHRLFVGLRVLTMLVVGLLVLFVWAVWT
ncbi:MAG: hypothetical protein ACT4QD_02425 [Acidobacteriota bacterium]